MDLAKLKDPFLACDVEWRVAQAGKKKDGSPWCKVLAYITNRAVMERLDAVCGPENWRNEFREVRIGDAATGAGLQCGISIKIEGEWVTKFDAANPSDIEPVKGCFSDAMKRAAVQWGIGRYLYDLDDGFAVIHERQCPGSRYANAKIKHDGKEEWIAFHWSPPALPVWAVPKKPAAESPPANGHAAPGKSADASAPTQKYKSAEEAIVLASGNARQLGSLRTFVDQVWEEYGFSPSQADDLKHMIDSRLAAIKENAKRDPVAASA